MKDPFFIPPQPWLSRAVQPLADAFGLATLPLHIHEVLFGFLLYSIVCYPISPVVSSWLFPRHYPRLPWKKQLSWDVHVVSLVQSSLINVAACWIIFADEERSDMSREERVWGYTGGSGMIQGLVAGYFLWDLVMSAMHFDVFGPGALAHAFCAFTVYTLGFRPFNNFYSPTFILWELSTPFLNFHWFMDKIGMTGTRLQLYNGILLLATFGTARLVCGTYESSWVISDMWRSLNQTPTPIPDGETARAVMEFVGDHTAAPLWTVAMVTLSNSTLNFLNFYWFYMMVRAVRKRFPNEPKPSKEMIGSSTAVSQDVDGHVSKARRRRV